MPLGQQDRHFMQLARDWTNTANPEFLEFIYVIVFHKVGILTSYYVYYCIFAVK